MEISNLSRPGVTGGIDLTHGGGPPLIEDNRPQSIIIKIGAGSGNAYAWTRQVLSPAGTMADGMDYGTTTSVPAYEINGSTTVASGTIVRAWPSPAGDGLIFQAGGSGSGDLDWRAYMGRDACPAAGQYLLSGSSQGYQTGNLATLSTSGDWATVAEEYPPTYIPGSHTLDSYGDVWAIPLFVRNWSTLGKIGFVGSLLNPSKVSAAIYSESATDGGVSYPSALLAQSGQMYLEQTTFGPANYQNIYWWNFNLAVSSNSVIWVALCLPEFSLNNLIATHPAGRMAPVLGLYGGNQGSPFGPANGATSLLLSRAIGLRADLGFAISGLSPSLIGWPSTFWPALNAGGTLYNFVAHLAGETQIPTGYDWWPALMYDTHPGTGSPIVPPPPPPPPAAVVIIPKGSKTAGDGSTGLISGSVTIQAGSVMFAYVVALSSTAAFPTGGSSPVASVTFNGTSLSLVSTFVSGTGEWIAGYRQRFAAATTGTVNVTMLAPYTAALIVGLVEIQNLPNDIGDQFAFTSVPGPSAGNATAGPTGTTVLATEAALCFFFAPNLTVGTWQAPFTSDAQDATVTSGGTPYTLSTAHDALSAVGTVTAVNASFTSGAGSGIIYVYTLD